MTLDKTTSPFAEKQLLLFIRNIMTMSWRMRVKISLLSVILYIFLFLILFNVMGRNVAILVTIPTIVIPFLFGIKIGIFSAIALNIFLTPTLFYFFTPLNFTMGFDPGIIGGAGAGLLVTAIIGFLYSLFLEIFVLTEKLHKISEVDFLTNIYNRRAIMEKAELQLSFFRRQNEDLKYYMLPLSPDKPEDRNTDFKKNRTVSDYVGVFSCAMIDLDNFKKINDTYGHLAGDEVLSYFGKILKDKKVLRESDIPGRYGGEEIIIIFPGTSARNAVLAVAYNI